MDTSPYNLEKPSKIALAALGVLLLLALVFYKERLFFADTSFLALSIVNGQHLNILCQRYGSFITQVVPYMGAKLHLPLISVLMGYAVSFNLFYLAVAAILVYRYKQYPLAILMSLYYFLIVSDSFFHANDEVHQGIAWMFLFFAVTFHLGKKQVSLFFLLIPFLLLAFLAVSSHFLVIMTTVFLWVYFNIEKKNWPFSKKRTILLSCLLITTIAFKFLTSRASAYENNNLHGVTHFSIKDIYMSFTTPVVQMFFYRCLINYWLAVIVFAISLLSLIKTKNKLLLAWTIMSAIGYIILMGLAFGNLNKDFSLYYVETEWTSISIIISAPFVFSYLQQLKPPIAILMLLAIFITRLIYISSAIPEFSWRTHFKEQVMEQMKKKNITKLALYRDSFYTPKCINEWAFPFETIMQSALNGDKPQLTFLFVNPDDKTTLEKLKNPGGFFDGWEMEPAKSLNAVYFAIDSTHPYQIMTYQDLMK